MYDEFKILIQHADGKKNLADGQAPALLWKQKFQTSSLA
jgi:hypothetical protein